jgi:hypothetical protein
VESARRRPTLFHRLYAGVAAWALWLRPVPLVVRQLVGCRSNGAPIDWRFFLGSTREEEAMTDTQASVILVRMALEERAHLKLLARQEDRSMSSMVRELIRREAKRRLTEDRGDDA